MIDIDIVDPDQFAGDPPWTLMVYELRLDCYGIAEPIYRVTPWNGADGFNDSAESEDDASDDADNTLTIHTDDDHTIMDITILNSADIGGIQIFMSPRYDEDHF
jgi:hypothetical protein